MKKCSAIIQNGQIYLTTSWQPMGFQLLSSYQPQGDQAQAIEQLVRGVTAGEQHQVLLGVTGSGKTFTMA
ncbi:MAG: hypothetical protein HY313_06920, partial [Acidobacteria bacterium]|nr:hypothetical protein [Acidobacteriota bacterium]